MSDVTYLKPISKVIDERFWELQKPRWYYSHHMYVHSPYETDDSCGNCDGARCEGCKLIQDPTKFEFCIAVDVLEDILVEIYPDVDRDIIRALCTSDRMNYVCEGYKLSFPSEWDLKESYPNFYKYLDTVDFALMTAFKEQANKLRDLYNRLEDSNTNQTKYRNCFWTIEEYLRDALGYGDYNATLKMHFNNQLYRLWDATGNFDSLPARIDKFTSMIDQLLDN